MAKGASKCLFLLFLSLLTICSSGTLVGFSCNARGTATSSPTRTISFLKLNKVTSSQIRVFVSDHKVLSTLSDSGVSVDLYLSKSLVASLRNSKSSVFSWLKTHVVTFLPHVNIHSIIISGGKDYSGKISLPAVLSTLKSIHSVLKTLHLESELGHMSLLKLVLREQLGMGDQFVQSMIEKATLASSFLPDVPIVLTIKSPAVPSATEVAQFTEKVSKSLENNTQITKQMVGLYAVVSFMEDFAQKELKREEEQIFPSHHRELLSKTNLKTTLHDTINPPTTAFPTTPISTTPDITPTNNPTPPTIVTVPTTNPVTITPTNPGSTPLTVPSTTPVTVPPTNPDFPPVPITNPVTTPSTTPGAQPITNPVTTYPAPSGAVPVTTPVTNPVAPPVTTNAPAIPGQSWCVAKNGALETAIQAALDYACGMGGADCSQIQQSGSCYNPNTLQNHASYAFNSYYQKNPAPTSCDFGGTAMIVNTNPSTGSCIFPLSSSSTPTPTTTTTTPTPTPPTTTTIPTPTPPTNNNNITARDRCIRVMHYVLISGTPPPTVLNTSSNPASGTTGFGFESPPPANTSTSFSSGLQPFIGCIILVTSFVTGKLVLDM
uniref:X8 domain-containing protein n=1 Tax=Fagus sylvatica TaxID=28930 RepID=A0A2N9GF73_FAGSY